MFGKKIHLPQLAVNMCSTKHVYSHVDYRNLMESTTKRHLPQWLISTLRPCFAIVATENLELHKIGCKTVFFNGDLSEALFTHQPEDFVHCEFFDRVCNLLKALYGL